MPGVAIVWAVTSVLDWWSVVPCFPALSYPDECMAVRRPDFFFWWRKVVGWEWPAPVVLARSTRQGNLDLTVCNAMTG